MPVVCPTVRPARQHAIGDPGGGARRAPAQARARPRRRVRRSARGARPAQAEAEGEASRTRRQKQSTAKGRQRRVDVRQGEPPGRGGANGNTAVGCEVVGAATLLARRGAPRTGTPQSWARPAGGRAGELQETREEGQPVSSAAPRGPSGISMTALGVSAGLVFGQRRDTHLRRWAGGRPGAQRSRSASGETPIGGVQRAGGRFAGRRPPARAGPDRRRSAERRASSRHEHGRGRHEAAAQHRSQQRRAGAHQRGAAAAAPGEQRLRERAAGERPPA